MYDTLSTEKERRPTTSETSDGGGGWVGGCKERKEWNI